MITQIQERSILEAFKGEILKIKDSPLKGRLVSLGIHQGKHIEIVRTAIFGGAYYVRVGRQLFGLRKEELALILVR